MHKKNDSLIPGYLKRSYAAVDGLWFMMVEKEFGFDKALEIDRNVWEIMPKIQARFLKDALELSDGLNGLAEAFSEKLCLDGCEFERVVTENEATFTITKCPWHETMLSSGREHLSHKIGRTICATEYSGWAHEFGDSISAEIACRICAGDDTCCVRFTQTS